MTKQSTSPDNSSTPQELHLAYLTAPPSSENVEFEMPDFERVRLANGADLIFCRMPNAHSFNMNIISTLGSQNEPTHMDGATHFMEHMACTGTKTKGRETFVAIDEIMIRHGGKINASTYFDFINLTARSTDYGAYLAADVTLDRAFRSAFTPKALEEQRGAILSEFAEYEAKIEYLMNCAVFKHFYEGTSLATPVLGRTDAVSQFTLEELECYYREAFSPERLSIVLVGNFDDRLADEIQESVNSITSSRDKNSTLFIDSPTEESFPQAEPGYTVIQKDISKCATVIAFPGLASTDSDYFTSLLFAEILGGGISSRLLRTLREEKGLVYSASSNFNYQDHSGIFKISFGTTPEKFEETLQTTREIIEEIKNLGVTEEELVRAKARYRSLASYKADSTSGLCTSFMYESVKAKRTGREMLTTDHYLRAMAHVSVDDINKVAKRILAPNRSFTVYGGAVEESAIEKIHVDF